MRRGAILIGCILLAGAPAPAVARKHTPPDWRQLITDRDRNRLRNWRTSWVDALTRARAAGQGAKIDAQGAILQPDAALERVTAPEGRYRCRLLKVGAQGPGDAPFLVRDGLHCKIQGQRLVVLDGGERPGGRLYPFDAARLLFLGANTLGDESGVVPYARDPDRNLVGVFERIAPDTWRLALPAPQWQSLLEVIELKPDQ